MRRSTLTVLVCCSAVTLGCGDSKSGNDVEATSSGGTDAEGGATNRRFIACGGGNARRSLAANER